MQSTPQKIAPFALPQPFRLALLLAAAVLAITASAKVQVPFWPVPMTLHTLSVMAIAVAAGPRFATAAFAAYLGAGALGFPVFSGTPERGIGLPYMAGPTGGYLLGYLVASWVVGALAEGRGVAGRTGAMLAGLGLVYAFGLAWLARFVPADKLLAAGVTPFLLGDLVKVGLVAAGVSLARPLVALLRKPQA